MPTPATNNFLDAIEYANVMLLLVKNRLVMGKLVNGTFQDQVTDQNGLTISVKRPPRFTAKDGPELQEQDIVVGQADLRVDQYKNVHIGVGDLETVQSYNALMRNQTMMSAASALAEEVESFLQDKTLEFNSWVGTPGVNIQSPQQFNFGWERLEDLSVPGENRCGILGSNDAVGIWNSLISSDIDNVNKTSLHRARIPLMLDIETYHTQKVAPFRSGTRATTGATLSGATNAVNYRDVRNNLRQTITVNGVVDGQTFKRGDVFTIEGVNAVNQRDATEYNYLQQFVILEDSEATGTSAQLTFQPPIVVADVDANDPTQAVGAGSAGERNVNTAFVTASAVPADGANITFVNAPDQIFRTASAFHKSSISLVFARLPMPYTGEASYASDPETGITIRYWRGSDINTGRHIHRWDMIFGATNVDPLLGTRISGEAA